MELSLYVSQAEADRLHGQDATSPVDRVVRRFGCRLRAVQPGGRDAKMRRFFAIELGPDTDLAALEAALRLLPNVEVFSKPAAEPADPSAPPGP